MASISKITKFSLGIVIAIAIFTIGVNFFFVPQLKQYSEENRELEERILIKRTDMDLPIRVLANIDLQVEKSEDGIISDALKKAYENNRMQLVVISTNLIPDFDSLSNNWNSIRRMSGPRHATNVEKLDSLLDKVNEDVTLIRNVAFNLDINKMDLALLNNAVEQFDADYDAVLKLNRELGESVVGDINFIANAIVVILIAIALIYSYGIRYFVKKEYTFVYNSFKSLADNRLDAEPLKRNKAFFIEESQMNQFVETLFEERRFISEIREILLNYYIVDDVMDVLFSKIEKVMGIDRIGIAFVDYERELFIAEYGVANYDDILLGPGFEIPFKETRLSNLLKHKKAMQTPDLELDFEKRPESASLKTLLQEGIQSNLVLPMEMNGAIFGMVFLSSRKKDHFTTRHRELGEKIISEIKGLLNRAYFTKVIFTKITGSFSELVDQKDNETGDHINRMVRYSVAIAEGVREKNLPDYRIDRRFILEIERNASSHDIGKVGIPDSILKKPGKLDPDEWEIMKTHAAIGADIFKDLRLGLNVFDSEFYKMAEDIARYHHERFDGTGYPMGLKGHDIPLAARIVAVADVFDALTSKRVYKEAFDLSRAVDILKESRGTHLDPVLVDVFLENISKMEKIMKFEHGNNLIS